MSNKALARYKRYPSDTQRDRTRSQEARRRSRYLRMARSTKGLSIRLSRAYEASRKETWE